jgi:hypothetical protein
MGLPTTGEKNDKIIYSFNKHICIFTFFFAWYLTMMRYLVSGFTWNLNQINNCLLYIVVCWLVESNKFVLCFVRVKLKYAKILFVSLALRACSSFVMIRMAEIRKIKQWHYSHVK